MKRFPLSIKYKCILIKKFLLFIFVSILLQSFSFFFQASTLWAQTETPSSSLAPTSSVVPSASEDSLSKLSFEELFTQGVKFYQEKAYENADKAFLKALELNPNNSLVLTNLALVKFQLGQKAYAVALLRKSLKINPDFSSSQEAIDYILPQLEIKDIPHEIQYIETLRNSFLNPYSLHLFLFALAFTLLISLWIILRHLGKRKLDLAEERSPSAFPVLAYFFVTLFFLFLALTVFKIWDLQLIRGTIISEKASVLSAPEEKAPVLFDLFAGMEVFVEQKHNNWLQVSYPGGLTGWIAKDQIITAEESKF